MKPEEVLQPWVLAYGLFYGSIAAAVIIILIEVLFDPGDRND